MEVPFFDLEEQYKDIRQEVLLATKEVFDSQRFILGPQVEELERRVARSANASMLWGCHRVVTPCWFP